MFLTVLTPLGFPRNCLCFPETFFPRKLSTGFHCAIVWYVWNVRVDGAFTGDESTHQLMCV